MNRWILIIALAVAACTKREKPEPDPTPEPKPKAAPTQPKAGTAKQPAKSKPPPPKSTLPEGFAVKGKAKVEEPFLPAVPTWRYLVSQLTTWRSDARRQGKDVLVTFDQTAVHLTDRTGARRTWKLPGGLVMVDTPAHLVLGADLTAVAFKKDGSQVPAAEEVTVVTARASIGGGDVEVFRLVIKGGRTFRSISTPG